MCPHEKTTQYFCNFYVFQNFEKNEMQTFKLEVSLTNLIVSVTEQLEQIISKISALARWPHLSQGGLAHTVLLMRMCWCLFSLLLGMSQQS